jgi:hypothetical protein
MISEKLEKHVPNVTAGREMKGADGTRIARLHGMGASAGSVEIGLMPAEQLMDSGSLMT